MRLSIGMPSFNNFPEVFFTVQALRLYHDLTDCEILVVDNYGKDPELEKFIKAQGRGLVRYEKYTESTGPANAKNMVFEMAKGEMVMCIDSHVLLAPGALKDIPVTDDLIHGPLMYNDTVNYCYEMKPVWRGHMWGIWGNCVHADKLPKEPIDIWGMGMGMFLTSKKGWLGFNKKFSGFGAEEGYIHEKYRKAGRRVLCYPNIVWLHQFDKKIPYPLNLIDRVKNYIIGFEELGMDTAPVKEHFGEKQFVEAKIAVSTNENKSVPPVVTPSAYEVVQEKLCSNSRVSESESPTRMGGRLKKNIDEAMPFFLNHGKNLPVVDIGCGDGFGMGCLKSGGISTLYGVELVRSRVETAKRYGMTVYQGRAEDSVSILSGAGVVGPVNVFCSHTLEHCQDWKKAVTGLQSIANIFWIIVPIEQSGISPNAAHCSPIKNLEQIEDLFDKTLWELLKKEYRQNLEPEGCVGFVRKNG